MKRHLFALDLAVKASLVALLVFPLLAPDLPQFQGKAMAARAATFWIPAALVPAVWWLGFRRTTYPWALDILVTLPFLVDAAGNAANLYDTVDWWDDANHAVNWAILTTGIVQLLRRLQPWVTFGLGTGFGAVAAILWELGEYVAFIRGNPNELRGAYHDTLGDLGLGLAGSVVAAALVAVTRSVRQRQAQQLLGDALPAPPGHDGTPRGGA